MQRIFVQDLGVFGVIIVVAYTLEEAHKKMSECENYDQNSRVDEYEIDGFSYCNLGDL